MLIGIVKVNIVTRNKFVNVLKGNMEKATGSKKTTSLKGNIRIKLKKKDTKRSTMGKTKTAKPVKTLKLVSKSPKAATSTDATVDEEGLNKNSALSKDEKTDASKPSKSKMDKTKSTKSDKDGKTLSSKINLKHKSIKERQKSKKIDKKLIVPKTAKSAEHSPTVNVSMINKSKIQSNEPQIQLCTTPVKSSLELSHSTPTSTIDPSKELDISAMKSIFASPNKYPSNKGTPMGSSRQLDFDGGIEVTPIKSVNNAVDEESNPESKVKSKSNREKSETKSMRDLEKEIFGDSDSDDSDDMFKISPKVQLSKIKATPSKSVITPVKSECTPAKSEDTPATSPCKQDDHPGHDEIQALQAELSSLNADSAGLNTSIHRTPVKHNKTSKRRKTPRKKTPLKSNSKKPRNITPIPLHEDSDDSADWEDVEGDDDDDDDTGLKIFEGDDVIDRKIEKHAQQSNLTALNVKTIIREVISNKSVVQMLKNTLKDAQNEEESSHDDEEPIQSNYELKMTRSKVKQVMGDEIPHPWLNSPKKKVTGVKKTAPFLDMTFSDEEEEDYNPEADDVEMDDSDVDSESVMSSQPGSDFGSPCPLTPTTPSSTLRTIAEESNTPKSTIMGPPQTPAFRSASKAHVERNLLSELSQTGSESQEPLARRTRSKLPLTDTPIDVIEQEFVAPDITEDMYDTYCDDVSWKTFLESLHSSQPTENLNDSTLDDDDEEYNFLAEVEEEAEDPEDLRDDKATKVSKKELQELMEELFEAYGSPDGLEEDSQPYEDNQTASTTSEPSSPEMNVFNNPEPVKLDVKLATTLLRKDFMMKRKEQVAPAPVQSARETIIMTVKEREQLDDQMRKHVQLLGQTYVLGIGTEDYKKHSLVCKGYVNELAKFSEGSKVEKSAYKAANLHHAVKLVNNECVPPGFTLRKSSRRLVFETPDLSLEQMKVFLDNGTFIYPDIVPTGNFLSCDVNAKMKTLFLEWEDNLIALGLSQLTEVPVRQQHELLSATWLPTKTEEQIRCRIKNMKTKKAKANAIKAKKYVGLTVDGSGPVIVEVPNNDVNEPDVQNEYTCDDDCMADSEDE
ncbi:unnamed protein product [Owenia fusiformis]|uniref:Uncharacterized protein n=1 Tax=Owenia fusiformis TaxID=6347 RepID=A0A8S4PQG9_OWEFU|nr:unnamed protein product [Owenia fusiformis]